MKIPNHTLVNSNAFSEHCPCSRYGKRICIRCICNDKLFRYNQIFQSWEMLTCKLCSSAEDISPSGCPGTHPGLSCWHQPLLVQNQIITTVHTYIFGLLGLRFLLAFAALEIMFPTYFLPIESPDSPGFTSLTWLTNLLDKIDLPNSPGAHAPDYLISLVSSE